MILFLDEERPYLSWVVHHRNGFVLDGRRGPTKVHMVLHRSTCPQIKRAKSKRTHWTTGRNMKGCALDADQLISWSREQTNREPTDCPQCRPREPMHEEPHLTRLDRDVLDYVLEITTIHLEENDHSYRLTVGMIARCLGKTEGQLMASFGRLVADGLLWFADELKEGEILRPRCDVMPTVKALQTLPAFAKMSARRLEAELAELQA